MAMTVSVEGPTRCAPVPRARWFMRVDERADATLPSVLAAEDQAGVAAGRAARDLLVAAIARGEWSQAPVVALAHEVVDGEHRALGLVTALATGMLATGPLAPHESTDADRLRRLEAFQAKCPFDVAPIVLATAADDMAASLAGTITGTPLLAVREPTSGVAHRWWPVSEELCRALIAALSSSQWTVMDGHHRIAAAAQRGTHEAVLVEWFPAQQMRTLGYDLVVTDTRFDRHSLREALSRHAQVRNGADDTAGHGRGDSFGRQAGSGPGHPPITTRPQSDTILVGVAGQWLSVTLPATGSSSPLVTRMHEEILGPVFNVTDARTDRRLQRRAAIQPADDVLASLAHDEVVLICKPPTVPEIVTLAARGEVLPPKSTYVLPKPPPGAVLLQRSATSDAHRAVAEGPHQVVATGNGLRHAP